ncbi:MAG: CheR family methyltransferase, partial [Saprospiraceae bacterium]
EALRLQVIPNILANKTEGDTVKIWVAACSSGEEAYSVSMLVQEHLEREGLNHLNVKVFASDVDNDALDIASRGVYPASIEKDIPPALLLKFFNPDGQNYQVSPILRKMVVFAQHDLLKDPPFSRVDLVSCRNMLIYIDPLLQKRVLKKFHFALNQQGYLWLGPSENIGILKEHMLEVERKWKLFQCVSKSRDYEQDTFFVPFAEKSFTAMRPAASGAKNALNNIGDIFKETVLEMQRFSGIFLDKELNVKHALGEFKTFLRFPDGNFNLNILKLVSPELAVPLGICVRKALANNEKVTLSNVKLQNEGATSYVNIVVKPWLNPKDYLQSFLFVVLEEIKVEKKPAGEVLVSATVSSTTRVEELEAELRETRQSLQSVIEEMETANEELQSQGEEMLSTNEELQSTNEELQSLNEELYTVSAEHQLKIKELIELNDDLNNYFKNSDIGQILVDRKLNLRKFSPAATRMVNLIESDIGRSILDITTNIQQLDLANSIKEVLKTEEPLEREISLDDGRFYSL